MYLFFFLCIVPVFCIRICWDSRLFVAGGFEKGTVWQTGGHVGLRYYSLHDAN